MLVYASHHLPVNHLISFNSIIFRSGNWVALNTKVSTNFSVMTKYSYKLYQCDWTHSAANFAMTLANNRHNCTTFIKWCHPAKCLIYEKNTHPTPTVQMNIVSACKCVYVIEYVWEISGFEMLLWNPSEIVRFFHLVKLLWCWWFCEWFIYDCLVQVQVLVFL